MMGHFLLKRVELCLFFDVFWPKKPGPAIANAMCRTSKGVPSMIITKDHIPLETSAPTVGSFDYRGVFSKGHSFKEFPRSFSYILSSI